MRLNIISLKLYKLNYEGTLALATTCYDNMVGNLLYPSPVPNLVDFQSDYNALSACISAWGPVGNRGSHAQLLALRAATQQVRSNLTQWGLYAESATPGDYGALASVGWPLRPNNSPVGLLPAPTNFRRLDKPVVSGETPLMWDKVRGAVSYNVYTAATPTDPFVLVATVSKTSFTNVGAASRLAYYTIRCVGAQGLGIETAALPAYSQF